MTAASISAAVARLLDEREAQGFDRHVTDPNALASVAAVLTGRNENGELHRPQLAVVGGAHEPRRNPNR